MVHPPADGFGQIAHGMMEKIVFGDAGPDFFQFFPEHLAQIVLEVFHKDLPAFTGQDAADISLVVLQVIEDMGDFSLDVSITV